MNQIFGVSSDLILLVLASVCGVLVLGMVLAVGRGAILLRIGLRNVPRRPLRTVLVVIGLALSTAVLTSALATGDTMTYNIRSLVTGTVGRVDELVVLYRRDPQRLGPQDVVSIVTGQLISGSRSYFEERDYTRLARAIRDEPSIAGIAPAIVEPMVAANPNSQQVGSNLNVIGLPNDLPPVFGELRDGNGFRFRMADLGDDEIYLNPIAATLLEAQTGDPIRLYFGSDRPTYIVGAIVATPGIGTDQPAVLMPLPRMQAILTQTGKINRILVANTGDAVTSVDRTDDAVRALRSVLVRDDVARQIYDILRTEQAQTEMNKAVASLQGTPRAKLEALIRASQEPTVTPQFKSLLGDPETIGRIAYLAFALRGTPQSGQLNQQLRGLTGLTVIDLKRAALDRAEEYGAVVTSVFVVVGLLSIIAALALVFLVFVLLTAERRGEIGVARAIGMRRGQLVATFLYEGLAYDLIGALIGVGIGVFAGSYAVNLVSGLLANFGVGVTPYTTPRSLAIAYLGGTLLTFLSVGGAAWRASRLNVVAAIRDLPSPPAASLRYLLVQPFAIVARAVRWLFRRPVRRPRLGDMTGALWALAWGLVTRGPFVIIVGLGLREFGLVNRDWIGFMIGVTIVIVGASLFLRWLLGRIRGFGRVALAAGAVVVILFWIDEIRLGGFGRWPFPDPNVSAYALRGLALVTASVWLACVALPFLLVIASAILRPFSAILPALRLALSYPASRPWRTALAMSMFAQVIFTMTLAAVLLNVTLYAYGDPEKAAVGYDIRGEPATSGAPPDIRAGIGTAVGVKESDFAAIGTLLTAPAEVISFGEPAASWRSSGVYQVDRAFLEGIPLRIVAWDRRFDGPEAAWRAFAERPGLALVSNRSATGPFQPATVWVRNPQGGVPVRFEIIGRIDPDASIPAGVIVPAGTLGETAAEVRGYFFRVTPGIRIDDAALGLNLSFGDAGLKTQIVGEEARRAAAIRGVLTSLLQVFLGLGLIAGLAALGILGVMAVVERRAQIGVLRAIGYRRWMVMLAFVLESGVIAGLGILLGATGGLVIARAITLELGRTRPEVRFVVPWPELGVILGVSVIAAILTAALPARQAGAVAPAEAIRG